MKKAMLLSGIILMLWVVQAYAWKDGSTHPHLTQKAIETSALDDFLIQQLSLPQGPNSNIAVFSRNKTSVLLNYTGTKPVIICNNKIYLDTVILESVWILNGTIHRENP